MGRLVMEHEKKWPVRGTLFQQGQTEVRDDIGRVTLVHFGPIAIIKHWIEVPPLAGQNLQVIKTGRVSAEMPLANQRCAVTSLFQQ